VTMRALLVALLVCAAVAQTSVAPPPYVVQQPLPCACLNTTTGLYANGRVNCTTFTGPDTACKYPFPALFAQSAVCSNGVWQLSGDMVVPSGVLVDLCTATVRVAGNLFLPTSSNISVFVPLNGTKDTSNVPPKVEGTMRGGQVITEGVAVVSGYVLMVLPMLNSTVIPHPANGTIYRDVFVSLQPVVPAPPLYFEMSNRTQFWQNNTPSVQCQTITTYPQIGFATSSNDTAATWSLETQFFDQCTHDFTLFVGIVAGVGGSIILATVVYAIVIVAMAIHDSIYAPPTGVTYVEMQR